MRSSRHHLVAPSGTLGRMCATIEAGSSRSAWQNAVLNQVYANVMGKPILVPKGDVTSLGSAIFAFLAAGTFRNIAEAQDALVPGYVTVEPAAPALETYQELYAIYRSLYFGFGEKASAPAAIGGTLPALRALAAKARGGASAGSAAS